MFAIIIPISIQGMFSPRMIKQIPTNKCFTIRRAATLLPQIQNRAKYENPERKHHNYYYNDQSQISLTVKSKSSAWAIIGIGLTAWNFFTSSAAEEEQENKFLKVPTAALDQKVADILKNHTKLSDIELIKLLCEYPNLKKLYDGSAQVSEGYTIEQHTLMVLRQYSDQKKFFNLNECKLDHITCNIDRVLRIALALHDIGKSLGPKEKQHEYTIPILQSALKKWKFSEKEIALATALIDHDCIGELLQPQYKQTPEMAVEKLKKLAHQANIDLHSFFTIQHLFYISDASAYPRVKMYCMKQDKKGQLHPINPQFRVLESLIKNNS